MAGAAAQQVPGGAAVAQGGVAGSAAAARGGAGVAATLGGLAGVANNRQQIPGLAAAAGLVQQAAVAPVGAGGSGATGRQRGAGPHIAKSCKRPVARAPWRGLVQRPFSGGCHGDVGGVVCMGVGITLVRELGDQQMQDVTSCYSVPLLHKETPGDPLQACTVHIAGCNYQNSLQACLDAPLQWHVFTDWSALVRVVCVHAHLCDWNNMWPAVLLNVRDGCAW